MAKLRTGENERAPGLGEAGQRLARRRRAQLLLPAAKGRGGRPQRGLVLDALPPAGRTAGSGAPAPGRPDMAIRTASATLEAQRCRRACHPRGLGDGRRHLGLAQLLEGAAADLLDARVPRDQHQRQLARLRRAQRRGRIGEAGAAADPDDAAWPVRRPQASAMCTAAASWRTWMSLSRVPIAASNSGMMWLPDSVKMVVRPAASSVRATMSAPLIWSGI